jgi:transcriptional regulator with XRE-family HTH domain
MWMSLMSTMSIGERIKVRREQRGLTQKDLASALQVSAQAVSKWERGENAPDIALLVELTRLLRVSTDWLLGVHATPRDLFEAFLLDGLSQPVRIGEGQ